MSFSFLDILLIIGITQGVVTASLLLLSKEKRISNTLLALAILSFCFTSFKVLLNFMGVYSTFTYSRFIPIATELAIAPLFYFYLVALTTKGFAINLQVLRHFAPFIAAQLYAFSVYWMTWNIPSAAMQDQLVIKHHHDLIKLVEDYLTLASLFIYLFLGFKKFKVFQKQVKESTADTAYPTLSWLNSIVILFTLLGIFFLFNMGLEATLDLGSRSQTHWQLYFVYLSGIIYYLGFLGYRQKAPDLDQVFDLGDKLQNKKISPEKTTQIAKGVHQLLDESQVFLAPSLNARQVAEQLNISQTSLSFVINQHFGKSFRELINDYRIEESKKQLLTNESKASVLSIALQSGFNSEASFYRVFKKKTGMSPKEFIAQHE
jgi:AraC-like DNA-binding protein